MNFAASAALQARSIYALMLRRIRARYTGSRAGYAWAIVEPIVWVFVLKMAVRGGSTSPTQLPPLGDSFEVFFATGVVVARTWRTAAQSVIQILIRAKREKLPTLHRLDSAYATWILEILTGGVALIIILAILQVFGFKAAPGDVLVCLFAFAGMAFFALAFALLMALILVVAPGLDHFRSLFILIVFFTSGFSFVVDRMPPELRAVMVWNPLLHAIEWFREGFYAGYECRSLDLVYLFTFSIVGIAVGLAAERALRRKAPTGVVSEGLEDV